MRPDASMVVAIGIPGIALAVAAAFVLAVRRAAPSRTALCVGLVIVWLGATAGLAETGVLARFDARPPPFAILFVVILAGGLGLGLSPLGRALARATPLAWLVGVHVFRLPLELVMHEAAREGVMPVELSFGGYNFDVVTGALAVPVALLVAGRGAGDAVARRVALAWSVLGLACLAVIAAIALAGSPMVRAFGDDPAHVNTWVAYFPFVWLPAVLVVVALAGHVIALRALWHPPAP